MIRVKRLLIICVLLFLPFVITPPCGADGWDSPSGFDTGSDQQLATTDSPTFAGLTITPGDLTLSNAGSHLILPLNNDAVTPTLSFGDGSDGFYNSANGVIRLSLGGTQRIRFFSGGIESADAATGQFSIDKTVSSSSNPGYTFIGDLDTGMGRVSANNGSLIAGSIEALRFGTDTVTLGSTLNFNLGTVVNGTETNTIAIGDGNPPAGTANQSFLYANSNVGGSSELFAMDEGGNQAQITGNTSEYPGDMTASVDYPYVNPRKQIFAGVKTYIAEHRALELLQDLLRNQGMLQANEYIIKHTTFAPNHNWEDNQERQRLAREQKIQDAQNKNVELDALIASKIIEISVETDLKEKLELIDERNELQARKKVIVPNEFIKKNPVSPWLISKGVKLE